MDGGDDDDGLITALAVAKTKVSKRTRCYACGGLGHATHVDGVGSCLTITLGNKVEKDVLSQITYPKSAVDTPTRPSRPSGSHDTLPLRTVPRRG